MIDDQKFCIDYSKKSFKALSLLFLMLISFLAFSKDQAVNLNDRKLFIPFKKNYPYADEVFRTPPITLFNVDAYQNVLEELWPTDSPTLDQLIYTADEQKKLFENLLDRFYGEKASSESPWNPIFIDSFLDNHNLHELIIPEKFFPDHLFLNNRTKFYGANFRPYDKKWFIQLNENSNILGFDKTYKAKNRAITVDNALLRSAPTADPVFYDLREPGEGYPFDAAQESMLRPGTPIYCLGISLDKSWAYIIAPEARGWIPITSLAWASDEFIKEWRQLSKSLGAITKNHLAISNNFGVLQFNADIGTVLPLINLKQTLLDVNLKEESPNFKPNIDKTLSQKIAIPFANQKGFAEIVTSDVAAENVVSIPWRATPRHFIFLINQMKARPYGWGNAHGYNDCSAEMKSLLVPFGLWLPRNSRDQMDYLDSVDYSKLTPKERVNKLIVMGKPFRTLVNFGSHTTLYVGKKITQNLKQVQQAVPYIYHNLWSIRDKDKKRRAIIGGAYVMPVTENFDNEPQLIGLASLGGFELGEAAAEVLAEKDKNLN